MYKSCNRVVILLLSLMQPLAYMVYLIGILVLLDGIIGTLVHNLLR